MTNLFSRMPDSHQTLPYRSDIDGLRGIAVLLVLVFHFNFFEIGKAGFIGVDIFFVISGYLISKIIWTGIDASAFSFQQFYIRRIRRLAPPLFATLLITFFVGSFVLLPQELSALAKEGLAALVYVSNIYYWRTLNYFGFQVDASFFLHTWSLAVEEQFYLFFPILLFILHKILPARRASPILILAIASFILNLTMVGVKPEATFYLLPTRAWELLVGALLAAVECRLPKSRDIKFVAGLVAVIPLAFALVTHNPTTPFPGVFALLPVLSASLLLYSGSDRDGFFGHVLSCVPLRYVGAISYSLYLVHWPIKVFLPLLVFDYSLFWKISGFGFSFLLATIMFLFIERPSKTAKAFKSARAVITGYFLTTAALFILFCTVILSGGWRERFETDVNVLADASQDKDPRTRECTLSNAFALPACRIGKQDAKTTWLIVGDSHAQALSGAFDLWLTERGEAGVLVFQAGCAPIYGVGDVECQNFLKSVRKFWNKPGIENVFLVSIWRIGIERGFTNDKGRFVEPNMGNAYLQKKFLETTRDIKADGRNVYLWQPLPPSTKSLPFSLARSEIFGLEWELGRNRESFNAEYRSVQQIFEGASDNLDGIVDPSRTMCSTGTCMTVYNGKPVYFDNNHPAASQKNLFANILATQLGR